MCVLQLSGMGILGVALWLRFDPEVEDAMKLNENLQDFYIGVYILIVVGAVMSLLGFLGCCGAYRQSQGMLVAVSAQLLSIPLLPQAAT